jgi:hypothetical protein
MPSKILINPGTPGSSVFWVEHDLLRIGSDPGCHLALDFEGVPDHVATLLYDPHSGGYTVRNACDQPIFLDGRPLARRASAPWDEDTPLQVADRVVLRLEIEGDAAPGPPPPAPADAAAAQGAASPSEARDPAKKKSQASQIAILMVLLAILAGMLALIATTGPPRRDDGTREFAALIDQLGDEPSEALVEDLRAARVAELRGDAARAASMYGRVRDELLRRPTYRGMGRFEDRTDQALFDFAISRL